MDDKRFDHLVRLVGTGASRRSILKGLLGLGGVVATGTVAADTADARGRGTRPTIPPPPPPDPTTTTTPAPTTTTTDPCTVAEHTLGATTPPRKNPGPPR